MKKLTVVLLIGILVISLLAGCGSQSSTTITTSSDSKQTSTVATLAPTTPDKVTLKIFVPGGNDIVGKDDDLLGQEISKKTSKRPRNKCRL